MKNLLIFVLLIQISAVNAQKRNSPSGKIEADFVLDDSGNIMHNETSGSVGNYERHLDRALELMNKYDYPAVKIGYVGRIIPRGEYHDGQAMVNHLNFVDKRSADFKIMVNSHESSRPTGYSRTYPNYIAAEAPARQ